MKIARKKGVRGIRIVEHNKKVFWAIIILAIALIGVVCLIIEISEKEKINDSEKNECNSDSDCVPTSCCHSASCTNKNNAPVCNGIYCTMECENGTLDCKQGKCGCVEGKCSAIFNLG